MWRAAVLAVRIERERLRQREPGRIGPGYLNRTKDVAEKVANWTVSRSRSAPDLCVPARHSGQPWDGDRARRCEAAEVSAAILRTQTARHDCHPACVVCLRQKKPSRRPRLARRPRKRQSAWAYETGMGLITKLYWPRLNTQLTTRCV